MLALDRVGKTYPNGVHALERFSAEIRPGEIVAIIGGSGCGKSTLLRAIAGLDRASTGTVFSARLAVCASADARAYLVSHGIRIVAADPGGDQPYDQVDLTGPLGEAAD